MLRSQAAFQPFAAKAVFSEGRTRQMLTLRPSLRLHQVLLAIVAKAHGAMACLSFFGL